jgi:hypothetical protein
MRQAPTGERCTRTEGVVVWSGLKGAGSIPGKEGEGNQGLLVWSIPSGLALVLSLLRFVRCALKWTSSIWWMDTEQSSVGQGHGSHLDVTGWVHQRTEPGGENPQGDDPGRYQRDVVLLTYVGESRRMRPAARAGLLA